MATPRHHRPIAAPGDGGSITAILVLLALLPVTLRCAAQPLHPSPSYARPNRSTFDPSLATVIIVLISSLFFLGFFTFYILQCGGFTGPRAVAAGSLSRRRRAAAAGLSPEVLAAFPTMTYAEAKALKAGQGALECAVCISEFEDDEALRLLPGCCHVFHPDCISAWLASHTTCPVCRSDLGAAVAAEDQDPPPASASVAPDLAPETADPPPDHVVVVDSAPTEEEEAAVELARIGNELREARGRSGRRPPAKLPRSHSTGHSLAQTGALDEVDRYTLRLPAHIRREIFAARKFHRAASCAALPSVAGEGSSSRAGYRGGGEGGSSRGGWTMRLGWSDRWPSLIIRTLSATVPARKRGDGGEGSTKKGEAESSSRGKLGAARAPFD